MYFIANARPGNKLEKQNEGFPLRGQNIQEVWPIAKSQIQSGKDCSSGVHSVIRFLSILIAILGDMAIITMIHPTWIHLSAHQSQSANKTLTCKIYSQRTSSFYHIYTQRKIKAELTHNLNSGINPFFFNGLLGVRLVMCSICLYI